MTKNVSLPPPRLPEWPWQAMMITIINCYLLWSLTWLQFLANTCFVSFQGNDQWFYTTTTDPFGFTIPESFLLLSIALSIFAFSAVFFSTRYTPKRWKRIGMVLIFSLIAIGESSLSIYLSRSSFDTAIHSQGKAFEQYHLNLVSNSNEHRKANELIQDKLTLDR